MAAANRPWLNSARPLVKLSSARKWPTVAQPPPRLNVRARNSKTALGFMIGLPPPGQSLDGQATSMFQGCFRLFGESGFQHRLKLAALVQLMQDMRDGDEIA